MKTIFVLIALSSGLALCSPALLADPANPTVPDAPPTPAAATATDATGPDAQPAAASDAAATDPNLPGGGFAASRYAALWTKSPFAVATPEDAVDTSPDYMFVGFAMNVGGTSYASLIDQHNGEHFLISTDKANRGLTLTSISRSHDGSDTYATVQKDGEPITLKLEQPPAGGAVGAANMPGAMTQQLVAPSANQGFGRGGGTFGGGLNNTPRFRRPLIHLPAAQAIPPVPAPAPAAAGQAQAATPPQTPPPAPTTQ